MGFVAGLSPAAWFRFGIDITVAGAGVSQWADQSGNGRDLKQGTDTNRPALQADGSILFDGVDNFLKCDAFTLNQPETVYILAKGVTLVNGATYFDGAGSNSGRVFQNSSTTTLQASAGSTIPIANNIPTTIGTYEVVSVVFNGANSFLQKGTTVSAAGDAGASNMSGFMVGVRGGGINFGNIQVKEVILFAAAHDAATRARVIRYLSLVGNVPL